ncbi:hypothetical protein NFI96_010338 [Prochilodus magdalenae]|nr:hypothetical protein NFI96_010338 [Prochilodus magdalenae]
MHTQRTGSGRSRPTTSGEDCLICGQAQAAATVSLSTIQTCPHTPDHFQAPYRRECGVTAPITCPATASHRHLRLQWCRDPDFYGLEPYQRIQALVEIQR